MDRLWAPWRIDYVSQPDKQEDGCFLCRAVQAESDRDCYVLWRTSHTVTVMNRWPYNNGHLLVAPRAHKGDLDDLSAAELREQMDSLLRSKRALDCVLGPAGYNVGLNMGAAAGAGLADHLHWHIVPRWEGDTNYMPVLSDTKVIPQSLDDLWERLRDADQH
ncbi:MAG: HIT domain-containing protein [Candidatus Brocadiia bacterium]